MLLAKDSLTGERIPATKDAKAVCPCCNTPVIAKMGMQLIHHWAHSTTANCDSFYERMTQWHIDWQAQFPVECRERVFVSKTGERHIADVYLADKGIVLEFQHSSISCAEIQSREKFYQEELGLKLVWVLDHSNWLKNVDFDGSGLATFDRKPSLRNFSACLVIDFYSHDEIHDHDSPMYWYYAVHDLTPTALFATTSYDLLDLLTENLKPPTHTGERVCRAATEEYVALRVVEKHSQTTNGNTTYRIRWRSSKVSAWTISDTEVDVAIDDIYFAYAYQTLRGDWVIDESSLKLHKSVAQQIEEEERTNAAYVDKFYDCYWKALELKPHNGYRLAAFSGTEVFTTKAGKQLTRSKFLVLTKATKSKDGGKASVYVELLSCLGDYSSQYTEGEALLLTIGDNNGWLNVDSSSIRSINVEVPELGKCLAFAIDEQDHDICDRKWLNLGWSIPYRQKQTTP